jgi:actin-related protein
MRQVLALYSSSKTTGIVLQSRKEVTYVVPILEGYALPHAIQRYDYGGQDISNYIMKILPENYRINLNDYFKLKIVDQLKESICYASLDYQQDCEKWNSNPSSLLQSFVLPDGNSISVGIPRWKSVESMFEPNLNSDGVHHDIYRSISKCDVDIHQLLCESIVLAGGNTMFQDLQIASIRSSQN